MSSTSPQTVLFFVLFVFSSPFDSGFHVLACNSRVEESVFWPLTSHDSQVDDPIQERSSFFEVHLARLDAVSTKHILNEVVSETAVCAWLAEEYLEKIGFRPNPLLYIVSQTPRDSKQMI